MDRKSKTLRINEREITIKERTGFDLIALAKATAKVGSPVYGLALIVSKSAGISPRKAMKWFTVRELHYIVKEINLLERYDEPETDEKA